MGEMSPIVDVADVDLHEACDDVYSALAVVDEDESWMRVWSAPFSRATWR